MVAVRLSAAEGRTSLLSREHSPVIEVDAGTRSIEGNIVLDADKAGLVVGPEGRLLLVMPVMEGAKRWQWQFLSLAVSIMIRVLFT